MEIEGANNGDIVLIWFTERTKKPAAVLTVVDRFFFLTTYSGVKEFDSSMKLTPAKNECYRYKIVGNINKALWRVERMLQEAYADE